MLKIIDKNSWFIYIKGLILNGFFALMADVSFINSIPRICYGSQSKCCKVYKRDTN